MIRMVAKLLHVLNSETDPGQISLALCLSIIMGFTPLASPHNILVLFLVLTLKANLSAFILGLTFFSGLAFALDPLFHRIGALLLTAGTFEGLWTVLYNITLWRLENFNNSIVMGSLFISLVLFMPFYFGGNWFIVKYRQNILAWFQKTRLVKVIKASKLYTAYQSISGLRGAS
jgi:uncharacterized protein (TIGR03546 family)